jgi:hypothetical protein
MTTDIDAAYPAAAVTSTVTTRTDFLAATHVAQGRLPTPQATSVLRTEPPTPLSNRLVGDGDAALSEEIFGISKAHTEPVVEPNGVTDDFRRESVAVVAGGQGSSSAYLPAAA